MIWTIDMLRRRLVLLLLLLLVVALGVEILLRFRAVPHTHGPLSQQAYVWQRAWTDPVRNALEQHGQEFSRIVILAAQVSWEKRPTGESHPVLFKVRPDWDRLKPATEVGLAIRINEFHDRFDGPSAEFLANLAAELCREAREHGIAPAEIQLDFDCPASKLAGYRLWVQRIKVAIAPTPVTITALPAWLDRRDFAVLAGECPSYVLQVHSLERPAHFADAATLCELSAARLAIERAARMAVPFRVALPTYGYVLAFDSAGQYLGLDAEGPEHSWPEGTQKRWLGADAGALADFLRDMKADRPIALSGIIWYRLPVESDQNNWRWPTLQAVMQGHRPAAALAVSIIPGEAGVLEVVLRNSGDGEIRSPIDVTVEWTNAELVAHDPLNGYEDTQGPPDEPRRSLRFRGNAQPDERLAPGDSKTIAWLRLDHDVPIHAQALAANH